MDSKLFSHIRTTEERDELLTEVELMLASLFEEKGRGFESCLRHKIRFWVSDIVRSEVGGVSEVRDYLNQLKTALEGFETLNLTLAFEPSDMSIDKFAEFIKRNIGEGIVIELEYDARILGGALITYKGEYRDFSLKRLFENEYKEKQPEIMKIMYSK